MLFTIKMCTYARLNLYKMDSALNKPTKVDMP